MTTAAEPLYGQLAPLYDLLYGVMLQPGRRRAMQVLAPQGGEHVLEVGVGTGWSAAAYPKDCRVTAIDLSASMVERAQRRFARKRVTQVTLCRMDAQSLAFRDAAFDAVYAPYVVNVVADPVAAAREMLRVCRPGGRLLFLNHFKRPGAERLVDRAAGRLARSLSGVNWSLELDRFVQGAGLAVSSIEQVNVPRVTSLMLCRKRHR